MRPQPNPALVLGVPRVRAVRPVATQAAPSEEIEIEVAIELAPTPTRAPLHASAPAPPPVCWTSVPTMRVSAARRPAHELTPMSAFTITPSEGVALPARDSERGDAVASLLRVARSIPARVSEHLVTFGVATFSFAFLAAVIATLGGSDAPPDGTEGHAQEPRAGYTRPFVEKLSSGARPQAETRLAPAPTALQMMMVEPTSRTARRMGAPTPAAAAADAARRAAAVAPAPALAFDDIPTEREPIHPVAAVKVAASAPSPVAKAPAAPRSATPRTAP